MLCPIYERRHVLYATQFSLNPHILSVYGRSLKRFPDLQCHNIECESRSSRYECWDYTSFATAVSLSLLQDLKTFYLPTTGIYNVVGCIKFTGNKKQATFNSLAGYESAIQMITENKGYWRQRNSNIKKNKLSHKHTATKFAVIKKVWNLFKLKKNMEVKIKFTSEKGDYWFIAKHALANSI